MQKKLHAFLQGTITKGITFEPEEATHREVLADAVAASAFGIVSGHDSGGVEKSWGAGVRVTLEGSRKVVVTQMALVASYMAALPEFKGREVDCYSTTGMRAYLSTLPGPAVQALIEKGSKVLRV